MIMYTENNISWWKWFQCCIIVQLEKHDAMPEKEQAALFRSEQEMQQEATHLAKFFTRTQD